MDNLIKISQLNDFIFCPISIYFHNLYEGQERELYQCTDQTNGTEAHKTVDTGTYSTRKDIHTGLMIYSEEFNLIGKIDAYDERSKELVEKKKKITTIYDGYIFQLYAQYYALVEMGFEVESLKLYSIEDNKVYHISLPGEDLKMDNKFRQTIEQFKKFDMENFHQDNREKCKRCIYEPICDRSANDI